MDNFDLLYFSWKLSFATFFWHSNFCQGILSLSISARFATKMFIQKHPIKHYQTPQNIEFQWKSPCQEPTIGWLLSQVVPAWSRIRPEFCSWSVFWWGKTCFHFLTIIFAENQNGTHRGFNSTFHSVDEWVTLECRRPTLFRAQCAVTQSNIERKYEQARVYYI